MAYPGFSVQDASLKQTQALPAAASTSTACTGFDLMNNAVVAGQAAIVGRFELQITAPALSTTELPDTKTCTYSIEHADTSNFASPVVLADKVILQTGAGGVGAAAVTAQFRLPTTVKRYVRVKASLGANTTDSSSASFIAQLVF